MSYVKTILIFAITEFLGSVTILGLATIPGWIPNPFTDPGYGWILPSFTWMSLAIAAIPFALFSMKRQSFILIGVTGFFQGVLTPPMIIIVFIAADVFFGFSRLGYIALVPSVTGAAISYLLSYIFVDSVSKMRRKLLAR